jgi:hypothetical protein
MSRSTPQTQGEILKEVSMTIKTHAQSNDFWMWTLFVGAVLLVVAITVVPHITVVSPNAQ